MSPINKRKCPLLDGPVAKRTTTRSNAGKPPARLGCDSEVPGTSNQKSTLEPSHSSESSSRSLSGRSTRSVNSTRTSRSVSSTVKQLVVDDRAEEDIEELQNKYEEHERKTELLEISVKSIIDKITSLKEQLAELRVSQDQEATVDVQQQLTAEELKLSSTQQEVETNKVNLKFELKLLQRKKANILRKAEIQRQTLEEEESEEDDDLSQDLSESEEDDPDLPDRQRLIDNLEEEQKQAELTLERLRLRKLLKEQQQTAAAALNAAKEAGVSNNEQEEDDLLIRLRNLRDPTSNIDPLRGVSHKTKSHSSTSSVHNNSEALSDHFAQVLSKAFEKIGSSSSSTDKFLARQVQGKDLPIFTGRPEEWSIFITAFENSTEGCKYTDKDNLPRLQKAIKGEALKTVQCLLSRPENVPVIMKKLSMRFGRPEHIVEILIEKAKEVPTFKEDRLDLLIEFGICVDNLVETVRALNCHAHLTSPQLLQEFVKKLPVSMKTKWIEWTTSGDGRKENLEDFAKWMSVQTEIACKLCPPKNKEDPKKHWEERRFRRREEKVWAVSEPSGGKPNKSNYKNSNCFMCDGKGHQVHQCRQFDKLDVDERWNKVKSKRLCFCCLKFGHSSRECRQLKECGQNSCSKPHHPLLHKDLQQPEVKENTPPEHVGYSTSGGYKERESGHISLMILPVQLRGPKGVIRTFAMLDPGATATVIDENTASILGLEGTTKPFIHSGLHPLIEEKASRSVTVDILNNKGDKVFHLKNVRTKHQLCLPRQSVRRDVLIHWKHIKNLPIECYNHGEPTILIGMDNFLLSNTQELRMGPSNAPAAGRTELGWVLLGRVNESYRSDFLGLVFEQTDEELHQLVKYHFTTEAFGVKATNTTIRSKEDVLAQEIMNNTIQRVGDHWESGLLWKSPETKLPSTKKLALSRLFQMERRMDRDEEFANQYLAKIQEYVEKGFARVLSKEEAEKEGERTFYLPHFMARNPKKPKKLRFVFDAAAKVEGVSFNDALLKGPDKLTSLPGILLKFRQRAIGITADIKDMFHRVKIREEDACAQRFLWRGMDRNREPDVLEMGVLIFGAACSPACAQEAKNLNAADFEKVYPNGAKAIIKYHYVDDYLDSVDTVESSIKIFQEVREIHLKGGFNLCNWISNSKALLSFIPEELHAPGVKNMDLESDAERVLGLFWKPEADHFTFSTTFLKTSKEVLDDQRLPTKRELLALVMSIYDPLGFLSNFTVKAKMLLQETWRLGVGWDDEVPKGLENKWQRWNEELQKINTFQLQRCYSLQFTTATEIELHIMCDASEQAFGAVGYFRIKKMNSLEVSFVMAKARVAPTKHLSLPRLELQAALLGSRLATFIISEHEVQIHRTVFWSDNTTVLGWIRSDGQRFKQFVACRVGEILETSDANQWRYVPSKENVADEMTRDSQPSDWSQNSRWINGPDYLKMDEEDWPKEPVRRKVEAEEDVELKKDFVGLTVDHQPLINVHRFSIYNRAIRSIAYVLRFVYNCRFPKARLNRCELMPEEIRKAELWWWRQSQSESFPEEVSKLKINKSIPNSSKLITMSVFLDEDQILRIRGRLENAEIAEETKKPVLLDSRHPFTKLLISHHHQKSGHHGQERVINELKQRFHIIQVRAAVRRSWSECLRCKKDRAQPVVPEMGQLPSMRVESFVRPFNNTGLDYFGPMLITVGRRHEKRWGALFTCLSTRAVHVELAASLNTDSCISAIRRFVARRGCPSHIYSDNGTNFVGANNEMKKSLAELNQQQMTSECTSRGISWHFIPPQAPHMGGSWERMVKSVKVALFAVLKERCPKEEVLQTLLAEAENIVNSHPLTHVPIDPDDLEALTPNHFLIGCSSGNQIPGHFEESDLCLRKQWRHAQQLSNNFWKRWVHEYLPTLLRRTKWNQPREPIQLGDVVLVVDNQLPRNSWPLGLVIQLYPGKDGLVRVVDVKTSTGVYKRPVAKLCKLDVNKTIDEMTPNQIDPTDGSEN